MLVISRKPSQSIMIGKNIRVYVVGFDRDQVRLGIEAPREMPVHRFESYTGIPAGASANSTGELQPVGKSVTQATKPGDVDSN
jgi:carbon storage regulator